MPVTSISLDKRNLLRQGRLIWLIALALVCAVIAGTRIFGNSPDYISYDQFFDIARQYHLEALKVTRFESGFVILSLVFTTLFSLNTSVYAALVFISMMLKGWVIFLSSTTLSIFSIIALLYLVRYFSLHELTQLRAALGIGLVLVGTSFIWPATPA